MASRKASVNKVSKTKINFYETHVKPSILDLGKVSTAKDSIMASAIEAAHMTTPVDTRSIVEVQPVTVEISEGHLPVKPSERNREEL